MGQAEIAVPYHPPEDYFALEATSELRHEYVEGEVFAMAEASRAHIILAQNLAEGLRGKDCQTFMKDVRFVRKENVQYVYSNVLVTCDPADRHGCLSPAPPGPDCRNHFARHGRIRPHREICQLSENTQSALLLVGGANGLGGRVVSARRGRLVDLYPAARAGRRAGNS